ncbi:uncharacterized protein C11orf24 homolog [Saccostrea echinata]|uniref:uncharacterized protein C11orf24 homolog n=1 Tax=Saccostrea echinata TaxID=191078 RepID=UPI002A83DBB9|nr:uncharacterized protein C11orf24 homolog [Saccostrea echinata]
MALRSVITAIVLSLTVRPVRADHCDVIDTLDNQWVNVNNLKNDHNPRYLSEAQVSSKEECQQACCQTVKCSVGIFDTEDNQSKVNCFLLECTSELECVFENKDGMVTFIVDKNHDGPMKDGTKSTTNAPPSESSTPGKLTNSASTLTTRTTPKNSTTVKSTTQLVKGTGTPTKAPLITDVPPVIITKNATKPSATTTRTATTPAPPPPNTTKTIMVSSTSVLETTTNKTTIGTKLKTTTAKASVSAAKSFGDQNATSVISLGPFTTTSASITNNTIRNSNNEAENMEPDKNNITSDELTNKEISQLLNITLPGLQVNESLVNSTTIPQIKPPPISTQSFVPLSSSSLSSSSTSSSTTTSSSPSSSSKSLSTTQQNKSSVVTTIAPDIIESSNVTKITTTTTKAAILTNISEIDHTNSSTETSDLNANKTMELKTMTQEEDKNVTNGRLENKINQMEPSSAVLGGLIALLCFGIFFIIAIMVIFGKKLFESWQRRHYSRIDYLVNGMYN